MVTKAGLGLIGLSAISIGGVAVAKPHWLGMDYMPEFQTLSTDSDYQSTYSESEHFGKKYGKYLAGVTSTNNKTDKNQKFWEWAFRQMSKEIENSKFSTKGPNKKIDKGFKDSNDNKALNQVCKEAYKTKESDFHNGTGSNNGEKFNKGDVWKYCSPVGQEPKTIKNNNNNSDENRKDTIGKEAESELISVLDEGNKIFWEIRDKEFKSKGESAYGSSKFFQKGRKDGTHIKKLCAKAYTQPTTNTDEVGKATTTETVKYCSLTFSA